MSEEELKEVKILDGLILSKEYPEFIPNEFDQNLMLDIMDVIIVDNNVKKIMLFMKKWI